MKNNGNLDKRIDTALSRKNDLQYKKKLIDKNFSSIISRVATELVAGLIIGTGIGLIIDNWLKLNHYF